MIELQQIFKTLFGWFRGKKWWQKKPPDIFKLPAIDLPLKDYAGDVIGRIIVNPNGVFVGTIESEPFRRKLTASVTHDFVGSITMIVNVKQPTPPWKRG